MWKLKQNKNIVNHNQQLWKTSLHNQTPGYQTKQCAPKVRMFDCFKSQDLEIARLRKLDSCAAPANTHGRQILSELYHPEWQHIHHYFSFELVEANFFFDVAELNKTNKITDIAKMATTARMAEIDKSVEITKIVCKQLKLHIGPAAEMAEVNLLTKVWFKPKLQTIQISNLAP